MIALRFAALDDVPLLLGLIRELAEYEKLTHELAATEERLQQALFPRADPTGKTPPPAAECILAFVDEAPVGYAVFFTNFSTFLGQPGLYLEDLFVRPSIRGRGIGKALLLHVAKLANARGCGRMEWTVLDWNRPAIEFYESLGARRMQEWQLCRLTGAALARYA